MTIFRGSPSGRLVPASGIGTTSDDVDNLSAVPGQKVTHALNLLGGLLQSALGVNWSAPVVLTLLPANHPPGLYALKIDIINRVSPTGGTVTKRLDYSTPLFGATSDVRSGVTLATGPGHINANALAMICVSSDGVSPIVLTLTPAGIAGAPVVDIYAAMI